MHILPIPSMAAHRKSYSDSFIFLREIWTREPDLIAENSAYLHNSRPFIPTHRSPLFIMMTCMHNDPAQSRRNISSSSQNLHLSLFIEQVSEWCNVAQHSPDATWDLLRRGDLYICSFVLCMDRTARSERRERPLSPLISNFSHRRERFKN